MPRWPAPEYRSRTEFRAPVPFVFRWCTDYRPGDDRLAGETYERRVISRTARRVVYEDLWWGHDGWRWRRNEVSLHPPNRWHARSIGNIRDADLDYRLTALPGERTRLDLRMRRRPGVRQPRQPAKRELEAELRRLWENYRRALESDYRKARPGLRARKAVK